MAKRPLYKEVREQLTKSLIEGEWRPGAMLPSEPRLADRYNVGISTIRAAVRELEMANVLVRAQGKGTFVARFDEREGVHRFLNIVRDDGVSEEPHRKMLTFERIDAPPRIAEALHLPRTGTGGKVFKFTTLVSLAGNPIYHSNVYLPVALFPRLSRSRLPYGNRSLYSLYQQQFNVNVTKVADSITATPAPAMVAKLCDLRPGAPVLWLNRIAYTYNEVRVEVRQNWINTAHHCYRIAQGGGG
jgi:GntR family transcriptional regulator